MKILLVEDDVLWAELIMELFNEDGTDLEIVHAKNGIEALSLLNNDYTPDVIISDMRMPGMDGHDLLMDVRSNVAFHSIPFIMLSSASCSKEMIEAHKCQATRHVDKPKGLGEMRSFISSVKKLKTAKGKM